MTPYTLHIEGLDLAGKSTVCRKIVEKTGMEHRHNSILASNPVHDQAEILRKKDLLSPAGLGWIFLGTLLYDLEHYEAPAAPVVQDSTILLRSIAYHSVFGDPGLADRFRDLLPRHPRFTATCILQASDEVRLRRLEGRCSRHNDNPEDFLICRDPKGFHRMEDILIETAAEHFHAVVVDTSNLEQDGEKDRVADLILQKAIAR